MHARAFRGRTWILVLTVVGVATSSLLELVHYRAYAAPGEDSFCTFGAHVDCESVALSKYAVLLGLPLPIWGLVGFVTLGLCAWRGSRWLLPLSGLAALVGVALTGVSAWGVGAWCLACELVHALSLGIFALSWRARAELDGASSVQDGALLAAPALGLLVATRLFLPPYWVLGDARTLAFEHGRTEQGDPWIGAAEPRLVLQEFIDYTCPHCKVAAARSRAALAEHPNELRIVRRHHPRMPCQPRQEARCLPLRIAFCADEQDRFWQADRWLLSHSQGADVPDVARAARELELDGERLAACVASDATFERAVAEWKRAKKARLPGTPYYATDDHIVTAAAARALIDAL
jgi:uncharacterized membrane protein